MSLQPWHVSVLIPARNEETLLPRCLRSVLRSAAALPPGTTFDVVVVVDSSTDATLQIAQQILGSAGAVVSTDCGVVGHARAIAAGVALSRYSGPLHRCWLANTDADCDVPETWLQRQLLIAGEHMDAIAGTVGVDSFAEHDAGVPQRFLETYLVEADGSHPHIHGANLGVRADAYLSTGGWRSLATAEDKDLWERLALAGRARVSTSRTRILTSGRFTGRAPNGFAQALAAHNGSIA
ncbi:glycosyltransferase family 2 protein [Acidipila sp. EB88]|uniref:glycosyltransferase n=1 Tax=Acidipila sp. EB88 TaxID=2305226 RepID=UPI000F5FBA65|nr:glycosyltransferase [Acidipila sp. EB88]RRA50208.1 glycosyltransferase [Acidipila sp. EB88]